MDVCVRGERGIGVGERVGERYAASQTTLLHDKETL